MTAAEGHSEIRELIRRSLRRLADQRRGQKQWQDKGKSGPGLLKTFEALEAILTPVLVLNDLTLAPDAVQELIEEDLRSLVADIEQDRWVPEPYLYSALRQRSVEARVPFEKQDSWCVDAASFAVTTFLDGLEYFDIIRTAARPARGRIDKAEEATELRDRLDRAIGAGVAWLTEQSLTADDQTQWTWGSRMAGRPSLYFTYSAAVALSAYLQASDPKRKKPVVPGDSALRERAGKCLAGAANWITRSTLPIDEKNKDIVGIMDAALRGTEEPYEEQAFLGWGLGILEAHSRASGTNPGPEVLLPIAKTMVELHRSNEYRELFTQSYYHVIELRGLSEKYEDRTLIFLAVRGVSWIVSVLREMPGIPADLLAALDRMVVSLFQEIINDQDAGTKLWSAGRFEIYRTQRSLEALSYVAHYFGDERLPSPRSERDAMARILTDVFSSDEVLTLLVDKVLERWKELDRDQVQPA